MILSVLAEGPLHGYGMIKAVEEHSRAGVLLDPANLYRVLRRMTEDGWIQPRKELGESRRRIYSITAEGQRVLSAELARLDLLIRRTRAATAGGSPTDG